MKRGGDADFVDFLLRQPDFLRQDGGILRHAAGMAFGVGVLGVDGGGDHFNRIDQQLAVLLGGRLEIADIALNVLRHLIEGGGKFADFRPALNFGALAEILLRDGPGRMGQHVNRVSDGLGGKKSRSIRLRTTRSNPHSKVWRRIS